MINGTSKIVKSGEKYFSNLMKAGGAAVAGHRFKKMVVIHK